MAIVTTDNRHYKNIANAIRDTGSHEGPIPPSQMAELISESCQTAKQRGKQEEYDCFWDSYQQNGERTNYSQAFTRQGWSDANFRPKYDIKPTEKLTHLFTMSRITDVVAILNECGVIIDTSKVPGSADQWTSGEVTHLPAFSFESADLLKNTFGWSYKLHTIDKVILREDGGNTFDRPFVTCNELTNLTIEGKIGQSGFDVADSKNLSRDSLMSIINALQDKTDINTTWTVTLGTTNLDKLSDAEKAMATQKGWTLA